MILKAYDDRGQLYAEETYYSVGGGFVQTARELESEAGAEDADEVPYPFHTAREMLRMAWESGLTIAEMKRRNEHARGNAERLKPGIARLWQVMETCIENGLAEEGVLPGGLGVRRRAKGIHTALQAERGQNLAPPHTINDWISVYAMAVNEVNAAGGQVVTAPTNGAAGVLPATLKYYLEHVPRRLARPDRGIPADGGRHRRVDQNQRLDLGGGSRLPGRGRLRLRHGRSGPLRRAWRKPRTDRERPPRSRSNTHLGMTCDPIKGLVQAPCIERNGLGAIKAVSAASLSLRGDGRHLVSLDACVETMRQTGRDMDEKYKETSRGGLAVNVPEC